MLLWRYSNSVEYLTVNAPSYVIFFLTSVPWIHKIVSMGTIFNYIPSGVRNIPSRFFTFLSRECKKTEQKLNEDI